MIIDLKKILIYKLNSNLKTALKLCAFLCVIMCNAQTYQLYGKVRDTVGNPIENVTLFASTIKSEIAPTYAVTDVNGNYKLKLEAEILYKITINQLGYSEKNLEITIDGNYEQDFILDVQNESLDAILLKAKAAILAKKDSIVFRTDAFTDGTEVKLKDVLNKLPGFELDRAGNVTVNGKNVDKLLIDGKDFFTDDEKLGVNNIPANAVDEVIALDNYNENNFLKGLENSDKLALNIILKKDKKRFFFGSIDAGAGYEDRHRLNPNIFYFSPKTRVNTIIEFNNIGVNNLSEDLINANKSSAENKFNVNPGNELVNLLNDTNFVSRTNKLGAFNLSLEPIKNWQLDLTSINSIVEQQTLNQNNITYLSNQSNNESRSNTVNTDLYFGLHNMKLRKKKNDFFFLSNTVLKTISSDTKRLLNSMSQSRTIALDETTDNELSSIYQFLEYKQKINKLLTMTVDVNYNYEADGNLRNIKSNDDFQTTILPIVPNQNTLNLINTTRQRLNNLSLASTLYFTNKKRVKVFPFLNAQYENASFFNLLSQDVDNGTRVSFDNESFNNDVTLTKLDLHTGFALQFDYKQIEFRPLIGLHNYIWRVQDLNTGSTSTYKPVIEPGLNVQYAFTQSERFSLRYLMNTSLPYVQEFGTGLTFENFNVVSQGNELLENKINHNIRLLYASFDLASPWRTIITINGALNAKSVRSNTDVNGIDILSQRFYNSNPEYFLNSSFKFSYYSHGSTYGIFTNLNSSKYPTFLNDLQSNFRNSSIGYGITYKLNKKKLPNINLNVGKSHTLLNNGGSNTRFDNYTASGDFSFIPVKHLELVAAYNGSIFNDRNINEQISFNRLDLTCTYQKEKSHFSYSLRALNLLDTQNTGSSRVSEFIATSNITFLQPRILMFHIIYNL